jgi:thioredoxin reductase (NADPH)
MADTCTHLEEAAIRPVGVKPSGSGCTECLKSGGIWVHLRLCLTCGHVGCCDSSPNRHATKHFHQTRHPVVRSYEPAEEWAYCYSDDMMIEALPAMAGEAAMRHFAPPRG